MVQHMNCGGDNRGLDDTPLEKLKSWPIDKLRRSDFAAVKSGRDSVSAMPKAQLIAVALPHDYEKICVTFDKEKYQLSVLRWMQRGLSLDKAIRKIEEDREIGHEIAERRQSLFEGEEWG